jgi:hypothetical protein
MTRHLRSLCLACLTTLLASGCGGYRVHPVHALGGERASMDRLPLEAVPCIQGAIRATFGVTSNSKGSTSDGRRIFSDSVRYWITADLEAGSGQPAGREPARLSYEVRPGPKGGSDVSYDVNLSGALRAEWLEQAFLPLEQCGAKKRR